MEPGQVVEFIDSQKIFCAAVLEIKNLRVRVLTENNREVKLAAGRLTHRSKTRLEPSLGRDKLVAMLKEISARRRELSRQVEIPTLWEVLNDEQEWIDLETMTAFCFPDQPNGDHEAAVIRAFFSDNNYFKFNTDRFFPHSAEKVEQIIAQREAQERKERLIDQGGTWMQQVLKEQGHPLPEESQEIIRVLKDYYLFDKDSRHSEPARAILKKAGTGSPSAIFTFLVKIGVWHPDENLELPRNQISAALPPLVEQHAAALCRNPPALQPPERRDLRDLSLITIDGPTTLDFDDALSLTPGPESILLGIHISDVGHFVAKGDPIDQEVATRGSSIYMPDQKISMLPDCLALGACSLRAGEERPAISTLITLSPRGRIIDFEIVPSVVRIRQQLTYNEVDAGLAEDEALQTLHMIARNYRDHRLDNGALIINLPDIHIWLNDDGIPQVARIDRESPSHLLVTELMIMANDIAARFLSERQLPAVFRSQPEAREKLFEREEGNLFQNWMQRKQISRFALTSTPEPHAGLGLPAYVTCTSPIRKYYDLVTQRQLRAALGLETPYTRQEVDFIIASLAEPMGLVGRVQYRRQRYWLLKHLESRIGRKCEATVLNKRRDGHTILLTDYLLECQLSGSENVSLKPQDLIQVTIQHVNARNDVITVYLG
jgi:exoribonuclease II